MVISEIEKQPITSTTAILPPRGHGSIRMWQVDLWNTACPIPAKEIH
jgi:hypothetical protein